jgi:hypothetical protein
MKGMTMKSTLKLLKAAVLAAGLVAVLLLPTGCAPTTSTTGCNGVVGCLL